MEFMNMVKSVSFGIMANASTGSSPWILFSGNESVFKLVKLIISLGRGPCNPKFHNSIPVTSLFSLQAIPNQVHS